MMDQKKLKTMETDDLVNQYAKNGETQSRADLYGDIAKFNRLFRENQQISEELKSREGDQRRALIELLDHDNLQVRLNAAKAIRPIDPALSRSALEFIKSFDIQPQSGDAGMSLIAWDRGIWTLE